MYPFVYKSLPLRIVFGEGTSARLAEEADLLAIRRALVLTTPGHEQLGRAMAGRLGDRFAGLFAGAVMHTPVGVTEDALKRAADLKADGVIAVGGGSTVGLGKAIALRTGLPQIAIPTTYAGSEMTPILGETQNGVKTTRSSPEIMPRTVIYDVDLTLSLPVRVATVSGMNALAHSVEALDAKDRNPVVSLMAADAIRAIVSALPDIARTPDDVNARSLALYGAWLSGLCLGSVGMALHHKLCHVLGGTFNLPHAETHAIVLPHAMAYNSVAVPDVEKQIAEILGAHGAASALHDLAHRLGIPASLREIGMPEAGIDRAAELAIANPYWNPRPLERGDIRELIARAWAGEQPLVDS
ncbi:MULTISPECIES: maleylacetate reductase [Bradyrhizobium]|uniref:Maleylacetate reductase n=2 Tax=Bradyrhizobium TaxID=374 RepID=A0ABY0P9I6_9BRAD|nr:MULTISPECIES: maleylacetate reductase [Bradyrhizobium]SDH73387.1 maleylacetate reductase [Bradyrhizobium ottawaense]SEE11079.1 maleylacetate reductase [Bradyrhizobium lablabi]SHM06887.1 maleylacetate reductase [Bradyrhizobium lablabi]